MTELAELTSRICVVCWAVFSVGIEDFYDPVALEWQRYMPEHCGRETVPCPTFQGSSQRDRGRQTAHWVNGQGGIGALMRQNFNGLKELKPEHIARIMGASQDQSGARTMKSKAPMAIKDAPTGDDDWGV